MTPRAEQLWSYLIGLAPVGQPVAIRRGEIAEDLKLFGSQVSMLLRDLMEAKVIRRIGPSLFVVKHRIGPCRDERRFGAGPRRLVSYAGSAA